MVDGMAVQRPARGSRIDAPGQVCEPCMATASYRTPAGGWLRGAMRVGFQLKGFEEPGNVLADPSRFGRSDRRVSRPHGFRPDANSLRQARPGGAAYNESDYIPWWPRHRFVAATGRVLDMRTSHLRASHLRSLVRPRRRTSGGRPGVTSALLNIMCIIGATSRAGVTEGNSAAVCPVPAKMSFASHHVVSHVVVPAIVSSACGRPEIQAHQSLRKLRGDSPSDITVLMP
jgi:hypothetical protein